MPRPDGFSEQEWAHLSTVRSTDLKKLVTTLQAVVDFLYSVLSTYSPSDVLLQYFLDLKFDSKIPPATELQEMSDAAIAELILPKQLAVLSDVVPFLTAEVITKSPVVTSSCSASTSDQGQDQAPSATATLSHPAKSAWFWYLVYQDFQILVKHLEDIRNEDIGKTIRQNLRNDEAEHIKTTNEKIRVRYAISSLQIIRAITTTLSRLAQAFDEYETNLKAASTEKLETPLSETQLDLEFQFLFLNDCVNALLRDLSKLSEYDPESIISPLRKFQKTLKTTISIFNPPESNKQNARIVELTFFQKLQKLIEQLIKKSASGVPDHSQNKQTQPGAITLKPLVDKFTVNGSSIQPDNESQNSMFTSLYLANLFFNFASNNTELNNYIYDAIEKCRNRMIAGIIVFAMRFKQKNQHVVLFNWLSFFLYAVHNLKEDPSKKRFASDYRDPITIEALNLIRTTLIEDKQAENQASSTSTALTHDAKVFAITTFQKFKATVPSAVEDLDPQFYLSMTAKSF